MLIYKVSGKAVLQALKSKGYSSTTLQRNHILGNATIQALRDNKIIGINAISTICDLLQCQISDLIVAVDSTTGKPYKHIRL